MNELPQQSNKHHLSTFCLRVSLMTVLAVLILGLPDTGFAKKKKRVKKAAKKSACVMVANFASQSCKAETLEEYFVAVANCTNEEDKDERNECKQEARSERREVREECTDSRDARRVLCRDLEEDFYNPEYTAADFLSPAETAASPNQYFPLVPGIVWTYQNAAEGETIVVTVTNDTRVIDGVTTMVVNDVVTLAATGETIEDTDDYYAQHTNGDVWYFGEVAQEFEGGYLHDLEGSFLAGEDDAKAGILMRANPQVGEIYRQEMLLREAEDFAKVLSITGSESVPGGSCSGDCLVTEDGSPLEPDAIENKYHAPGIGTILEIDLENGARTELISMTGP